MFLQNNIKWLPLPKGLFLILSLLVLSLPVYADGRSAQFNQVFGRYLQRDATSYAEQSERAHLIWMAYLLNPEDPAVLLEMSNIVWTEESDFELSLRLLAEAFDNSNKDYYIGLELLQKSAVG